MIELRTVIVGGLAFGWVSLFTAAQAQLTQRVDDLIATLQAEVQSDEVLAGIRVMGGEIAPRRLAAGHELRLVAEGGRLEQRVRAAQAVRAIMARDPEWRSWLETNGVVLTWYDVPVDVELLVTVPATSDESAKVQSLLERVQDHIELDPDLAGAVVVSAMLARRLDGEHPGRELRAYGRVVTTEQSDLLARLFVDAMAADPYWRPRRDEVFVSLRALNVTPPSPVFAQRYFTMGLKLFWQCRYLEADAAFMRAIAESPADPVYRYWRIVTLLALGQEPRAEQKLTPLLYQNPWGQFAPTIAVALERVQGPLRWRLQSLEQHVLLTLIP
ncbi:MAG TPA: hypothetical protein VML55_01015 [Planctomycetaceae bacterium]|nr:hypothetical protein [Planctomycetaceae bacterium]